jgi:dihydrodipicolinate reductase
VTIRVCVSGITEWVGKPLAMAIRASDDMTLSAGVSRAAANEDIGKVPGIESTGIKVSLKLRDALKEGVDLSPLHHHSQLTICSVALNDGR